MRRLIHVSASLDKIRVWPPSPTGLQCRVLRAVCEGITVLNRPICLPLDLSVSDLKSSGLAGFKAFIWSNLCTRHIPEKLTPRGHHDWPVKRAIRTGCCSKESRPDWRRYARNRGEAHPRRGRLTSGCPRLPNFRLARSIRGRSPRTVGSPSKAAPALRRAVLQPDAVVR